MRRALTVALVGVAVAAGVVGCSGDTGPSQEELRAASDAARSEVVRTAEGAMSAFQDLNPDRTLTSEDGGRDYWSYDCGDTPAPTGKAVEWVADRSATVDPGEPTETLLDPVVDRLVADGWEVTRRSEGDSVVVRLVRHDYIIEISGDHVRAPGYPPRVSASVYSPCLVAPELDPDE